ncbi:GSCFA domain-containing protein [Methylobacterium organophilum]|nr:GSCFA domain-containing protein [Methylobacterium organophilum]UMY16067.1 GSCFA domain-containing protein [Methylobacterium organophilum]
MTVTNPYSGLPDARFWRRAVAGPAPFALDPAGIGPFPITREDRIATGGSCFAQNVARALRDTGFHYHVTETAPEGLTEAEAARRQFGTYSARYGNLYHTRQLVQLFDRAYDAFAPEEAAWVRPDGRFVDPFRPTIEPEGFADAGAVAEAARVHLAAVRTLFETLDVFVFTLGLTEGWRARGDGAAYPLAPGVAGGAFDPERYAFVNATVSETVADLDGFLERLRGVNARARVILTVSPVPLIATYEDRHVLVSSTYSKAVLRAAAGEVAQKHANVAYFPAYEIVTGGPNAGRYFEEDLRSVTPAGIAHVMRVFLAAYVEAAAAPAPVAPAAPAEFASVAGVICDEEEIERSLG